MQKESIELTIFAGTLLFVLLSSFIIYFVIIYRRNQREIERERLLFQTKLDAAGFQSHLEIKESTLQKVSQEIHDGIGQKLTLTLLYINQLPEDELNIRKSSADLIENTLYDLRNICKNLSGDYVIDKGIEIALEREACLINSSRKLTCRFHSSGMDYNLTEKQEIILFRCAQEALNNAMRHSNATEIEISVFQNDQITNLCIKDNGIGFNANNYTGNLGISNMKNRIELLSGKMSIESEKGKGVVIEFQVPNKMEDRSLLLEM